MKFGPKTTRFIQEKANGYVVSKIWSICPGFNKFDVLSKYSIHTWRMHQCILQMIVINTVQFKCTNWGVHWTPITAKSNDRHVLPNYRSIGCLFSRLLDWQQGNFKSPCYCFFVRGIRSLHGGFPAHRGSYAEMFSFDNCTMLGWEENVGLAVRSLKI